MFTEVISDPRVVEQIGAESGAAVKGALYTGALSETDGPAPTYIDMMRYMSTPSAPPFSATDP